MKKAKSIFLLLALVMLITASGIQQTAAQSSAQIVESDRLWEWVAPPQFARAQPFVGNFAAVSFGEPAVLPNGELADFPTWGLINQNGDLVLPMEYSWVGVMDGALMVSRSFLRAETIYGPEGQIIAMGEYDGQLSWFPDGTPIITRRWIVNDDASLTLVYPDTNRSDWRWEVFIPNSFFCVNTRTFRDRTTNEILIPSEYYTISPISRGFARVIASTGWGVIDANNNIIIPPIYTYIQPFLDCQLLSADQISPMDAITGNTVTRGIAKNGRWGLINNRGEFVVDLIFEYEDYEVWPGFTTMRGIAEFHNGIAPVRQGNRWGVIDTMGNVVVPIRYRYASTTSGLAVVQNDAGYFGAYDRTGRFTVPFEYERIFAFNSDRIAVTRDGKVGFVDMSGTLVIEHAFDHTFGFIGEFASVSRDGRMGLINRAGEIVVPIVYDFVWDFSEGIATVQVGDRWGFIRPVADAGDNRVLEHAEMDDFRFINMQIDNPIANNSAILTQIDAEDDRIVPIVENGRTLVPIRFISENFDCEVDWDDDLRKVTITRGDTIIELHVDSRQAYVNGEAIVLDVAPIIRNGRTLVPVRFLSESMGFLVDWDGDDKVVRIELVDN